MTVPSASPLYLNPDLDLDERTKLAIQELNRQKDEKEKNSYVKILILS